MQGREANEIQKKNSLNPFCSSFVCVCNSIAYCSHCWWMCMCFIHNKIKVHGPHKCAVRDSKCGSYKRRPCTHIHNWLTSKLAFRSIHRKIEKCVQAFYRFYFSFDSSFPSGVIRNDFVTKKDEMKKLISFLDITRTHNCHIIKLIMSVDWFSIGIFFFSTF